MNSELKNLFIKNLSLQSFTFDSESFLSGDISDSYIIIGFNEEFLRWEPHDRKIRNKDLWKLRNRFMNLVRRDVEFFRKISNARPEKEITIMRSEVMK